MTARKMFSFFMDKSWSPSSGGGGTEKEGVATRRRLSISRSGRFKEQKKLRVALDEGMYSSPNEGAPAQDEDEDKDKEMANGVKALERTLSSQSDTSGPQPDDSQELQRREATLVTIRNQIQER